MQSTFHECSGASLEAFPNQKNRCSKHSWHVPGSASSGSLSHINLNKFHPSTPDKPCARRGTRQQWDPSFTYSPSMRSQWPVRTQIRTSITDRENESSSAAVKRPQQPKEILEQHTNISCKILCFHLKNRKWTLLEHGSTAAERCQEQLKGSSFATNRYQNSNKIKAFPTFKYYV